MAKGTVEELQKFLPKSIEDVVRENGDILRLALATENMNCRTVSVDFNLGLIGRSDTGVFHVDGRKLKDEQFINLNGICTALHDMGLGHKYGVPNPAEDI